MGSATDARYKDFLKKVRKKRLYNFLFADIPGVKDPEINILKAEKSGFFQKQPHTLGFLAKKLNGNTAVHNGHSKEN